MTAFVDVFSPLQLPILIKIQFAVSTGCPGSFEKGNISCILSILARSYPFRLGVKTDDNEDCLTTSIDPTTCEADLSAATQPPGGITGFALNFYQGAC